MKKRQAAIKRTTKETGIALQLKLDGTGKSKVQTGIPFFDHMLTLFAKHAIVDLTQCPTKPGIGEVVDVIPNHCCAVSNMNDQVHGVRNGVVEVTWPVKARGKVR